MPRTTHPARPTTKALRELLSDVPRAAAGPPVDPPIPRALALADAFATTCFVADRQDTGTTALLLPRGTWTAPQFGAGSATAHRAAGIREISDDVGLDLRTDVDTADDLAEAIDLGVGPNTARLMS